MEQNTLSDNAKKVALEELSREELIVKCKSFLAIAQKAKQAKDSVQEEINELKRNLANDATSEIVENLTQQKLEYVTAIEDLKKQNSVLNHKLQTSLEELCLCEKKNNDLDSENVSYKRQVKRLTEENEQLISHLEGLEKLGLEQQNQLLTLESLRNNLEEKDNAILILSNELKLKSKELEGDGTVDKLKEKLKLYHGKIVKFAGNVKVLKENKNEILKLFKIYTDQVELWKIQLTENSQKIVKYIAQIEEENRVLKETNKQLEAHKTDDEKSKAIEKVEKFKIENLQLGEEIKSLLEIQEEHKSQIENLLLEKESINKELSSALEKHQNEIKVFDAQNKKDTLEIQSRKEENEKICIEYRKIISKLEEEIEVNSRAIEDLRRENLYLKNDVDSIRATEKDIADRTNEEIMKLVQENSFLTEKIRELEKKDCDFVSVQEKNLKLLKDIEYFQSMEKQFADKSSEEITKLMQENSELSEKLKRFEEISTNTSECQTEDLNESEEIVVSLKRENTELLAEMNEMNQALKERGETISKLQAHCEEVMKKFQVYETQANKKEEIVRKLQEELESVPSNDIVALKDKEIRQLKTEIENLKSASLTESQYAESENMSTSTISRTDEVNRLKELEGSWEERYGKLRNLALKLKRKIADLTNDLTKEQNEKKECLNKLAGATKTITTLQSQCDKLEDDLDESCKLGRKYLTQLDGLNVDIVKDKEDAAEKGKEIEDLKREIADLKQEKAKMDQWKKQISAKVQILRKEQDAARILKDEYEKKIAQLTSELAAKEQALKEESDCHKQTKTNLEHSNNERKKHSVLDLEMQDYERSVKDLSHKVEKKQEEIDKLKSQLETQKNTVAAVREQNKMLEERAKELENNTETARLEIVGYKKQILEFEDIINLKDEKILSLTQSLESVRGENEELATELSKVIAEHQKLHVNLKSEKDYLKSQTLGLQQSLRETQEVLKLKEEELKHIQRDYENYKVRAQSVLRQTQSRDVGLEDKLNEEVSNLKTKCERLASELTENKDLIEKLKKDNEDLLKKKDSVCTKLQETISEGEDLKNMYDQLVNKHQQVIIEHGETVRGLKVHAETLSQCYRQQLSEQEVRHNREIIELQSKMEKAPSPTEPPFPSLPTMHREEGEGSESTEPVLLKPNMYPVPLERLLGSDSDQEVSFIKKQLSEEESKVAHLTALLADTEQDLAKHAQMNKLLKEEIRRHQRSVEREQHAENLEYLKNVIFKFITLQSGDERSCLVPVLNTILKLSPEETQKLTMVARGDPGIKAWTNYLPLWSSPSKP